MRQWLGILLITLGLQAQEARIQILGTTDLHGHLLAQDTFTLQPANRGWARLATLIRGLRAANPNTLLVDCGNATGGDPIGYVWSRLKSDLLDRHLRINAAGYYYDFKDIQLNTYLPD